MARVAVVFAVLFLCCSDVLALPQAPLEKVPQRRASLGSFLSLSEKLGAALNSRQIVRMTNQTNTNESYLLSDESCVTLSPTSSAWIDCSFDNSEITTRLFSNDPKCAGSDFLQSTEEAPVTIANIGNIGSGFIFTCDPRPGGTTNHYTVTIFGDSACKDINLRFDVRLLDCFERKTVTCGNATLTEWAYGEANCNAGNVTVRTTPADQCMPYPQGGMMITCNNPVVVEGNTLSLWGTVLILGILFILMLLWMIRPVAYAYLLVSLSRGSGDDKEKKKKNKKKNLDEDEDFDADELQDTKRTKEKSEKGAADSTNTAPQSGKTKQNLEEQHTHSTSKNRHKNAQPATSESSQHHNQRTHHKSAHRLEEDADKENATQGKKLRAKHNKVHSS